MHGGSSVGLLQGPTEKVSVGNVQNRDWYETDNLVGPTFHVLWDQLDQDSTPLFSAVSRKSRLLR